MSGKASDRGFGRYLTDEHRERRAKDEVKAGDVIDGVTMVPNPDYVAPATRTNDRPPRSGSYALRDRGFGRHLPDDS